MSDLILYRYRYQFAIRCLTRYRYCFPFVASDAIDSIDSSQNVVRACCCMVYCFGIVASRLGHSTLYGDMAYGVGTWMLLGLPHCSFSQYTPSRFVNAVGAVGLVSTINPSLALVSILCFDTISLMMRLRDVLLFASPANILLSFLFQPTQPSFFSSSSRTWCCPCSDPISLLLSSSVSILSCRCCYSFCIMLTYKKASRFA